MTGDRQNFLREDTESNSQKREKKDRGHQNLKLLLSRLPVGLRPEGYGPHWLLQLSSLKETSAVTTDIAASFAVNDQR